MVRSPTLCLDKNVFAMMEFPAMSAAVVGLISFFVVEDEPPNEKALAGNVVVVVAVAVAVAALDRIRFSIARLRSSMCMGSSSTFSFCC